jgi:hypothetical protein
VSVNITNGGKAGTVNSDLVEYLVISSHPRGMYQPAGRVLER